MRRSGPSPYYVLGRDLEASRGGLRTLRCKLKGGTATGRLALTPRALVHEVAVPIAVFIALDLALTGAFLLVSPGASRVGTFRPPSSLPPKVLELVSVGLAVGLVACLGLRRLDIPLLTLGIAFVVLLDVDHLPSFFDVAQPIRPVHSLAFLALEVAAMAAVVRRPDVVLISVAAWFGHMAGDQGVFAVFAPFSFTYYSMAGYVVPLAVVSVAFALSAGYSKRRAMRRLS